jgi:hypothetical protein
MVVNNLDLVGLARTPNKANAPLIVDADAVLPVSISFQTLNAVRGQSRKSSEIHCGIEYVQFAKGRALDRLEAANTVPAEKALGIRAAEGSDHLSRLYWFPFHVNQYNNSAYASAQNESQPPFGSEFPC